ncbi:Sir2 family NAD-dependent protein deacetylase [Konateibacter massiliensis]|uniref:Sir2 family NAD-dependent protein deacetylase n=1 Tax=Konateibacter massiliensis TaxID=2002841 RepID=UPI000C15A56E|nr:Sir2 family NAD-dependent protein deacetylase [Konateibacter massiliensis]
MKLKELDSLINHSNNIVCIAGRGMAYDCGYPEYLAQDYFYNFENKYRKSMEEVYSIGFYKTRTKQFFDIYKEEILKEKHKPSLAHYKLAQLEKAGKLKYIITKDIFNLSQRAGCKNVIDLYGNSAENYCPKCGQRYSVDYIIQSKGLPKCLECNSTIRPEIKMYGEMIDNNKLTKAKNAIAAADILLILDADWAGEFSDYIKEYRGNKAVLVKEHSHESDQKANYVIYDKSKNVLPKLRDEEKIHVIYDSLVVVNK